MFINAQPSRARLTQACMGAAEVSAERDVGLVFLGGVREQARSQQSLLIHMLHKPPPDRGSAGGGASNGNVASN